MMKTMPYLAWSALRGLIVAAFAVMVAAAILQVLSRYVFNSPLGWTEELARLMLVWWTFAAVGMLAFQGKLLGIDALLLALSARPANAVVAFAQAISTIFTAWLVWLSIRLVRLAGSQITPALDIPYAYIYLSLPVGLGVATLGFAWNSWRYGRRALQDGPHPIAITERTDV
jgi:TRAP-type transport system small permease protein